ncbi:hypothetical protein, partial [Lacticaseibacillus manihotivorans]|uniref:hypothetical protein n=1 Tax=Lacticaseibacillus manihotivorans TaxID=88233 RepID=UPI000A693477
TFDLVLTSGQQRYHLTRTFAVNADQIPTTKTQTQTTSLPWWVYLLIGLVIIMFGMIIWLFNTRKKNENTPNDFSDR